MRFSRVEILGVSWNGKEDSLVSRRQNLLTLPRCPCPLLSGWALPPGIRCQIGVWGTDLLKPPGAVNFHPLPCLPEQVRLGAAGSFPLRVCSSQ